VPAEASTRDDLRVAPAAEAAGAPPCGSPAPHSPESWAQHWETLGYRKLTPAFVSAIQMAALKDFSQHYRELDAAYEELAHTLVAFEAKHRLCLTDDNERVLDRALAAANAERKALRTKLNEFEIEHELWLKRAIASERHLKGLLAEARKQDALY
jgi:hypothetical protein